MNPRTLMLSWLRTHTRGRPSTATVTIPVSELLELEETLEGMPKGSRGPRKQKGLTSRSKQRKRPDTPYLNFVRQHPCCSCGTTRNVEAHHEGSKAQKGMGMKVPDSETVPLCDLCHKHDGFHRWGTLPGLTRAQTKLVLADTKQALQAEWAKRKDTF